MTSPKRLSALGGAIPANYIEDVFSTYLYAGTGSSQTITNNIDTSTKGGLVWIKGRSGVTGHRLTDTVRGATKSLASNDAAAEATESTGLTSFGTTGFTIGADADYNTNAATYASWTFREQAKFFDVVTFTTNSSGNASFNHALESTPGCILFKTTNLADDWYVWHRSTGNNQYLQLNTTIAAGTASGWCSPTNTGVTTANGFLYPSRPYVAYLFANNAGGFGATGTDNVISCGSYTGNGSADGPSITLGYEAAWVMTKNISTTGNWQIQDVMRGMALTSASNLMPNLADAEDTDTANPRIFPTATGFKIGTANARVNTSGQTYIYIAIRRGPMKTPTSGTSVLGLNARAGSGVNTTVTGGTGVTDLAVIKNRTGLFGALWVPRLTANNYLVSSDTASETTATALILQSNPWDVMNGVKVGTTGNRSNDTGATYINYLFSRAPGFFDVVCYTGNGSATQTVSHNLTVPPEMYFFRERAGGSWWLYHSGFPSPTINYYARLNATDAATAAGIPVWGVSNTTFNVSTNLGGTTNTAAYIAYLFASCPGVSKVGRYTGTGALQTINCGFAAGARFVVIKRTDSTGDWWVYDSARGITSGNDPYFFFNTTAVEVTNTNYVDTDSTGFKVTAAAPAGLNANGGTYIFLAIA